MSTTTRLRSIPHAADLTRVAIALTDSGDLVAAITGRKIIVWDMGLTVSDPSISIKFQSGGTTDLTGAMFVDIFRPKLASLGMDGVGPSAIPHLESALSEKLNVVASAPVVIGGWVTYSTALAD